MGQKLTVDFDRKKGKLSFPSTVHPLFLTFNLTQVICLEGEGSLYIRKMVDLQLNNEAIQGFVYIWNHSIRDLQKINYES
jgi:hypothetical protein